MFDFRNAGLLFMVASLLAAIVALPASATPTPLSAEQSLIVDCLLPGKVRKLGINKTYVSRKRPSKTSANDCEIRGGDYVRFDRATIASSLNVWQEAASKGDAKAQYYVGEIFEKGIGTKPDYESAVLWYKRAIKQEYKPAKMSLGRLYEQGLGVPKDLVTAMNLYRQASGLEDDEIAYASVFEGIRVNDKIRIVELEKQLAEQQKKIQSMRRRAQVLDSDYTRSQRNLKQLKVELEQRRAALESAKNNNADIGQAKQLTARLNATQNNVTNESKRNARLQAQLKNAKTSLLTAEQKIANLQPTGTPKVALKWPAFEDSNGVNSTKVPAGSIVNIVGAIENFNAVKSFKINDQIYQLDANGLFLKTVDVSNDVVVLSLEMIDQDDVVTTSQLHINPSNELNIVLAGGASLTRPKFDFGSYHALVIGNNSYDMNKGWEPLDTAVNDATEVANVLRSQYGFKVRLELNADRDTMLTALEEMRRTLTNKDNLLVYYAGHGLVDPENDQGYWVPVDGSTDSAVRWVSNASITDQIRAMTARNVMVIADSCYSGSLMRSGIVTLRSGLSAEKKALRLNEDVSLMTRVALSSGGLQPVIDSVDNSKHSVFANALLSVLKGNEELLDADSLATQVAYSVAIATQDNVQQVPRYAPLAAGGHQGGEFYFAPKSVISK